MMQLELWQKLSIVIATACLMEGFAWWAHKYIMHGWGWDWHKDHHEPHDKTFEKNDLFAVVFGSFALILFIVGFLWFPPLWYVAAGITVYGIIYSFVHDGLVHQRYPMNWVPRKGYFKRLVQAHKVHHAMINKDDCVSFGFVIALDPQKLHNKLMVMKAARQDKEAASSPAE